MLQGKEKKENKKDKKKKKKKEKERKINRVHDIPTCLDLNLINLIVILKTRGRAPSAGG